MQPASKLLLPWIYVGERPYREVWDFQETRRAQILSTGEGAILLLVAHPPTISLGRSEKGSNLLFPADDLRKEGFDVVETNRGGKVTYHGPGQLVAYPVVDLRTFRMGVRDYVAGLEETMIRCLGRIGISARRRSGFIGTWVGNRKIGSIGIHLRKLVSIHGLALNVSTNLDPFRRITPCGIDGVRLTSVEKEGVDLSVDQILEPFIEAFSGVFACELAEGASPFRGKTPIIRSLGDVAAHV